MAFVLMMEQYSYAVFFILKIGMMAEMARSPVNLDNLMNEGIAFAIDRLQVSIPDCSMGMRPVMIGRRNGNIILWTKSWND